MLPAELPSDPAILQSYINTLLRDFYPSLKALCEDKNIEIDELLQRIEADGLEYNAELNKIW